MSIAEIKWQLKYTLIILQSILQQRTIVTFFWDRNSYAVYGNVVKLIGGK